MLSYCCCKTISIHALREEGDHPAGILPDSRADFYPRPPRGGRQRDVLGTFATPGISIHALREEGDVYAQMQWAADQLISIHALREEGDRRPCRRGGGDAVFLSTPSARRATAELLHICHQIRISIHALREEGDCRTVSAYISAMIFLSTPSARRAT